MDCAVMKVTTADKEVFRFSKTREGIVIVKAKTTHSHFETEVVKESISDVKEGDLLSFEYFVGLSNTEEFISETPVVKIEKR